MERQQQAVPEALTTIHAAYAAALKRAPLDGDTRRAYDSRVRIFLAWLEASGLDGDPLTDAHDRDFAIRDYKTHMKTVLRRASNTVNAHLTALDHFFTQLGLGPAVVRRDDAPKLAPRALDARQQKRYLRAVERRPLARDRAIGRLLFYSGVRIAELVALDDDDVPLSARKGKVIVRSGKGETSREIPLLDGTARTSTTEWRTDRASWPGADMPRARSRWGRSCFAFRVPSRPEIRSQTSPSAAGSRPTGCRRASSSDVGASTRPASLIEPVVLLQDPGLVCSGVAAGADPRVPRGQGSADPVHVLLRRDDSSPTLSADFCTCLLPPPILAGAEGSTPPVLQASNKGLSALPAVTFGAAR
ncbi:tyrosine-type recombinase/integrase [Nonomuraea guangzhouensis]|uniref:Tyrosine-type recombinase/integrase n=1 Tax=Nonomuraea guangzhouensis TaxID=1291555 RepID=A0ABW4GX22_9ACTN|nr:tyrosine-type recombinase/integrase [Nonomuraea guangzhouensis]